MQAYIDDLQRQCEKKKKKSKSCFSFSDFDPDDGSIPFSECLANVALLKC